MLGGQRVDQFAERFARDHLRQLVERRRIMLTACIAAGGREAERQGAVPGHERIGDAQLLAAGAGHAHDVPVVDDLDLRTRHDAEVRFAAAVGPGLQHARHDQPVGVIAAARPGPLTGDPPAPLDRFGRAARGEPGRQQGIGVFAPDIVGRLPVVATLEDLDEDALVEILTTPKNALVKQYQRLFEMEDVSLSFTDGALESIAQKAVERKTGARGLRSIMENILLETMFDLPGLDGVEEIVINREVAEDQATPLYIYADRAGEGEASA